MAKIALLNDTHFGINNNSQKRLKYQLDYFESQLFPVLEKENVKQILHLGDFWHSRKEINPNTFHWVKARFLDHLRDKDIRMEIVPGNHDMYFTQNSNVNSLSMLREFSNITVHTEPTLFKVDDYKFSLIPWISNAEDFQKLDAFIKANSHDVIFGHFALVNFFVTKQMLNTHGYFPLDYFKDFDAVYSGHFHIRQDKGNIHYLGTQYELNWNDADTDKGFTVIDTMTGKPEYYRNPDRLHCRIFYDDTEKKDYDEELAALREKFVRVIVTNKTDEKCYQSFIQKLEQVGAENFTIIEQTGEDKKEDELQFTEEKPLFNFLEEYCNTQITLKEKDKENIIKIIKKIYLETVDEHVDEENTVT